MPQIYSVILTPDAEGGFNVSVPSLPEVCTQGETEDEAIANAREAIELAINKKLIVDKLLYGKTTVGTSPLSTGWAAPAIPASEFSPEKAKKLLEDAGWKEIGRAHV